MSEISIRLSEIQKTLKTPKGQKNNFGNYRYRSLEDIMEAVKPLFQEDEFVTLSDDIVMVGDRFYVKATASFHKGNDVATVTAYARESLDKKGMDASQITGSTSSYARKYACNGLFAIDDTKDADSWGNKEKDENEGWENLNIRVPKDYFDIKDPQEAQKRLGGPDFKAVKLIDHDLTKNGWFIFARKGAKPPEETRKVLHGAPEPIRNAVESPQNVNNNQNDPKSVISESERIELFRQVKEKGIHQATFKKYLKDTFGLNGTVDMRPEEYLKVTEWLIRYDSAGVGQ